MVMFHLALWLRCPRGHLIALENDPKNWSKPVIILFHQQIDPEKYSYYGIVNQIADYAIQSNDRLFFMQTKAGKFRNHPELKLINSTGLPCS